MRADLEGLRSQVAAFGWDQKQASTGPPGELSAEAPSEEVESDFLSAVEEYRKYSAMGQWRGRNAVDQQLVAHGTWIPAKRLTDTLPSTRESMKEATVRRLQQETGKTTIEALKDALRALSPRGT